MGGIENFFVLDAQAHQRVDIEKAAVVELMVAHTPVGKPIVLVLEHVVQLIDIVIDGVEYLVHHWGKLGLLVEQASQGLPQHLLVAMAPLSALAIAGACRR